MTRYILSFLITAAFFLPISLSLPVQAGKGFIIVVHKENGCEALSTVEIQHIFLGKQRTWPNGAPITLVMNKNDDIHELFTRSMLQKSPTQLSVYWRKILYSGASMLPLAMKDDEAVKSYLNVHQNAISYIAAGSLDKQVHQVTVNK